MTKNDTRSILVIRKLKMRDREGGREGGEIELYFMRDSRAEKE